MVVYAGFDISTTTIGVTVLSEGGDMLFLNYFKPTSKEDDNGVKLMEKAKGFKKYLDEVFYPFLKNQGMELGAIFIEEPLSNANNANTTSLLNRYNGMCTWMLTENGCPVTHISVHESRSLFCPELVSYKKGKATLSFPKGVDKKVYLFNKISKLFKYEWPTKKSGKKKGEPAEECYDMTDSYVVCLSGIKKLQL